MYLNCKIQVIINGQIVGSVVSVEAENDAFHIGASCTIVMPLNARIEHNNDDNHFIINPVRVSFNTGDHIIINAKYEGYESFGTDGEWIRVFEGFLYDFYESTPIKIKCLDYIYWFNLGIYGSEYVYTKKLTTKGAIKKGSVKGGQGKYFQSIEFADLLQDIVDWTNTNIEGYNDENGTDFPLVTLLRPEFSFNLLNITFINMSPAAVLEHLKKELGFNISLSGSQLYANLASFTTGHVKLASDKNVIECNLQSTNLTKRRSHNSRGQNSVFLRIKVKAYFAKEDGTKDSFEVGDPNGQLREVFFYKVDKGPLKDIGGGQMVPENYIKLANEALNQAYMKRYTGSVETYLYPNINLFDKVSYSDVRYPERDGDYVATSEKITLDDKGFHRSTKLAFLSNYNIVQNAGA